MRFSFWRRLQNQTRTTSFSMHSELPSKVISSDVGFGFCRKARSNATRVLVSILVRFLRRRPLRESGPLPLVGLVSGCGLGCIVPVGLLREASASSSHRCSSGFSLHMFLKLKFNASNLEMVVWLKSLPYSLPIASPTSPWVNPALGKTIN